MQSNILSIVLVLLMTILFGPVLPKPGAPKPPVAYQPPTSSPMPDTMGQPSALRKMVLGYFVDGTGQTSSIKALSRNARQITDIGGFWYTFYQDGNVYGRPNSAAVAQAAAAGIGVYPLVHNIRDGHFDKVLAHTVLGDAQRRQRLVSGVAALAWGDGARGVVIDIEDLYASDRPFFEAFLAELKAAVGAQRKVIVAVPAKWRDDSTSDWSGAFDYARIGQLVDCMALMSYDQHTFGSGPGPVAAYGWDEKVVRYTVERVPPRKVLLGLAGYGYHWVAGKATDALTHPQIVRISEDTGAQTQWSEEYQSPYLLYWDARGNKNEIWFENHTSLGAKLSLVDRYGLQGVALWRLGQEDQRMWAKVAQRWFS